MVFKSKLLEYTIVTIFIIFSIIAIVQIILELTNHSPTPSQVAYIFIGVIVSYLFIMSYYLGVFVGRTNEFKETTNRTFSKVFSEIDRIKK